MKIDLLFIQKSILMMTDRSKNKKRKIRNKSYPKRRQSQKNRIFLASKPSSQHNAQLSVKRKPKEKDYIQNEKYLSCVCGGRRTSSLLKKVVIHRKHEVILLFEKCFSLYIHSFLSTMSILQRVYNQISSQDHALVT